MGKMNRGETTKLSIRTTAKARENIGIVAANLKLSRAGVIMFALNNILKEEITRNRILSLEGKFELAPDNFAVTIKKELANEVSRITLDLDMKKNIWVGLLVSEYFEERIDPQLIEEKINTESVDLRTEINTDLKKKIVEVADQMYVPLNGLVSYSILKGAYEDFPKYQSSERETLHTYIPAYVLEEMKKQADARHVSYIFYVELCLYKAFMSEDKIFD